LVRRTRVILLFFAACLSFSLAVPAGMPAGHAAAAKQLVFDEANLLSRDEYDRLNAMANDYGAKRETDIIIYTSANSGRADVVRLTEDFYDERGPGYDQPHGNAVILTMDMRNREVYMAGFYKAKSRLDDARLDRIRAKITPALTRGDYEQAFTTYIRTAYTYLGYRPGVNPDNILFKLWFQLAVSLGAGGIIVGLMAYRSGGRVTVNRGTYENAAESGILERQDQYLHTTVTKTKIERNKGGPGGTGGGGGTTGGGHSHSGSRGSF
jgi:uncharacterized protein